MKEKIGQATGDAKTETEGKVDKAAGKVRNAVGGLKDAACHAERDRQGACGTKAMPKRFESDVAGEV